MNCKEVAFKAQSDDDVELVLEPVAHGLGDSPVPGLGALHGQAAQERCGGFACGRLVLGEQLAAEVQAWLHRSAMVGC